jgi:uncharacterized membrane protein
MAMDHADSADPIESYLRRLRWALQLMPEPDRERIVLEVADHLAERAEQPNGLVDAFAALGPPHEFARGFIEDFELSGQLNRAAPGSLLLTVLARGTRSASAAIFGLIGAFMYLLAIASALVAVAKLVAPRSVGWWWGSNGAFAIGIAVPPPTEIPEHLGYWIVPLFVAVAVLAYTLGSVLLRAGARRLLNQDAGRPIAAEPSTQRG